MAGIYIHIPFCKSRCIYCDFYSTTQESKIDTFTDAICTEINLRKDEITESVSTIYFGGGTPSLLQEKHLRQIFDAIESIFQIKSDSEITIEANPDDLSNEYIEMLTKMPFNRISIGIQSFDDNDLKFLNRRHSAKKAIDVVGYCQKTGFDNISIDLMYGITNQSIKTWQNNLHKAIKLNVQHISAYHLIYEEQTKLYSLLKDNKITPTSDELSVEMFSTLISTLTDNGFEHYEISNFARDKMYSKHNTSYWQNKEYLGFGPSAHSYNGKNRSWNKSSLDEYLQINNGIKPELEVEYLTKYQQYNEFIITGLRTVWGINLTTLKNRFGNELYDFCLGNAKKSIEHNLLHISNNSLMLTKEGIFISDGIMSDLMWI